MKGKKWITKNWDIEDLLEVKLDKKFRQWVSKDGKRTFCIESKPRISFAQRSERYH